MEDSERDLEYLSSKGHRIECAGLHNIDDTQSTGLPLNWKCLDDNSPQNSLLIEDFKLQTREQLSTQQKAAKNKKELNEAAARGDLAKLRLLLENEVPVNPFGPIGMNPLHAAASNGHLKTCQFMLKWPISPNLPNKVGKTALHLAAQNGFKDIVELLLSNGADVNSLDIFNMTPLHWVCEKGHESIALLLIKFGANPIAVNKFKKTPFKIAQEKGFYNIVKLLQTSFGNTSETNEPTSVPSLSTVGNNSKTLAWEAISSAEDDDEMADEDVVELSAAFNEIPTIFAEDLDQEEPLEMEEGTDFDPRIRDEPLADSSYQTSANGSLSSGEEHEDCQDSLLDSLIEMAENFKDDCSIASEWNDKAADLLEAQASLGSLDDSSNMLMRALENGHTIQLTEAGRRALAMITPDSWIFPTRRKRDDIEDEEERPDKRRVPPCGGKEGPPSCAASASSALVPCNSSQEIINTSAALNYLQDYMESLKQDVVQNSPQLPRKKSKT